MPRSGCFKVCEKNNLRCGNHSLQLLETGATRCRHSGCRNVLFHTDLYCTRCTQPRDRLPGEVYKCRGCVNHISSSGTGQDRCPFCNTVQTTVTAGHSSRRVRSGGGPGALSVNLPPGICSSRFKGARCPPAAPAGACCPPGVVGFGLRRRSPPGAFCVPPGHEMRAP